MHASPHRLVNDSLSDFYLHRSAEESLPALLRVLLFAARQIVGEVDYNIIKFAMDGRKISFLKYKGLR